MYVKTNKLPLISFLFITMTLFFPGSCTSSKAVLKGYGYSEKDPVMVGGGNENRLGRENTISYLNALKGPNGESIAWQRAGSCCSFDTPNGFQGKGMLDIYMLRINESEEYIKVYINKYDEGELKAPAGFLYKPLQ